jgi:hypothetical protein
VDDLDFARSQPVGLRHVGDNLAVPVFSDSALRVKRFILLHGCQQLAYPFWREGPVDQETGEVKRRSEFRVSVCSRNSGSAGVRVYQNGESVGYRGTLRCGNVWTCIRCCSKVMRRRNEQIRRLFDCVHLVAGEALMVTFTAGHTPDQSLEFLLDGLKKAKRRLTQNKSFRRLIGSRDGAVTVTEVMFGDRGWHPHQHDAWFYCYEGAPDAEQLASDLFPLWEAACTAEGLKTIEFYKGRRIGVDVRASWSAAEYLTKFDRERDWSVAAEITAGRLKTGKSGSMTPWGLLEEAIQRGPDSMAAAKWIEYMRATKNKAVVSLKAARELLELFELPVDVDDVKDANEGGEGAVIGELTKEEFEEAARRGGLGRLLEQFRSAAALQQPA